ncbi:MAG: sigma-54-dependent Fis family transcriptional regulator [Deltaproteobacteria bacterium]|nr:sigma-54-dependent Fis family transcriptional regulator [Deltaproteobacteria bacterium]
MNRPTVLFIDDQPAARELFTRSMDARRYRLATAAGVAEAEEFLQSDGADVAVTDLRMPGIDGLQGLERFHKIDPDLPVVVITAFGSVETAVEAMKRGAFDYLRKPFDPSELEIVVERAINHRQLVRENNRLRSVVSRQTEGHGIIGHAPLMQAALQLAARAAPSDLPVLILGESGTGKDVFAQHIHKLSHRAKGPFVSLNCSAIPEHLLESELFGHEKGAFSGANQSREGFFAEADGGTLFLDEIGDMSLALQPKLLRVLQNGEYYRVGSRRLEHTNVRVVCASNRAIEQLAEHGQFRQDLYYRINTVRIELPPLRKRTEDIGRLVEHFLNKIAARDKRQVPSVAPQVLRALVDYRWPGNVRELEHVLERSVLICDGSELTADCLPPELLGAPASSHVGSSAADIDHYKDARKAFEVEYFTRLLARSNHSVQRAAELAGLHRSTLYEKLAALGLAPDAEAPAGGKSGS